MIYELCSVCRSHDVAIVRELWDAIDRVVVVDQVCHACGSLYLSTRRPTADEARARYAHHYVIFPQLKGRSPMRFFDCDVPVYLDAVTLRLDKKTEDKLVDLTLRVQPFDADLAEALHPDVRALLFTGTTPHPLVKAVELRVAVDTQHIECSQSADEPIGLFTLREVEISDPRVRTEKGVDGLALVFYATLGPVGRDELEQIVHWYTQVRYLTFNEAQAMLTFDAPPPPARRRRAREMDSSAPH